MSSYKNLTNSPAFNKPGEGKWDVKTPSYDWDIFNGQIALQSDYPELFSTYGLLEPLTYNTLTEFRFPQANSFSIVDATGSGINNTLYIKSR